MPRLFTSKNEPMDFCRHCWPDLATAERHFATGEEGPDGRGDCFDYDTEHPPYDDEIYTCCACECDLNEDDEEANPEDGSEKEYTFTIHLVGNGRTLEEAWKAAAEAADIEAMDFDDVIDFSCDLMEDLS